MSIDSYPLEQPQPDYMIVTSSTRPTNPYEGLHIYETDTDRMMFWNGGNWVQLVNFRLMGVGSSLAGGAAPPVDTGSVPFRLQCGTAVGATDGAGDITLAWPVAFPAGVISVIVVQGDNTHAGATYIPYAGSISVSGCKVRVYTSSGSVWANSGNMRINWIAIGW